MPSLLYLRLNCFRGILLDPAKHDFARPGVDLFGPEAGGQPNLGHDVVRGIVAPPGRILRRVWRQLGSDDPLDFGKSHWNFLGALRPQELAQTSIFTHASSP